MTHSDNNWRFALDRLEAAYSPHTIRAYTADFTAFEKWCKSEGLVPLPTSAPTLARFIAAQIVDHTSSTVSRQIVGIRKVHRLCGHETPEFDEEVVIALRRARRSRPSRPGQVLGLTSELRDMLVDATANDLTGLRNRALIMTAYDTLCRRSELVGLRAEDIGVSARGKSIILVRRAKNDPFGRGRSAALSTKTVSVLGEWLQETSIDTGPLIRPVYKGKAVDRALAPYSVARLVKRMAAAAGLDTKVFQELSGHSMRVGAAQDLMSSGHGILTIMRAGGWKSVNVVARYVENAELSIWE